jgi:hypothetical protein
MKLTPENEAIVEKHHWTGTDKLTNCLVNVSIEHLALAIQNATALKCAEMVTNGNWDHSPAMKAKEIREAFGLAPENEE